ncbi:DUF6705 family protein [Chryseobacterium sp. SL1]|uniref:DUF6705 family protein n=1 Tax=Chryseobacterium sp. SL1 TaxID=2995159 RepID=UPI0022745048|nr:DUF6705 family protein [Chryseobacterium sp. SL1]MCY1661416.1 hypothetical protein [Chryseobacterium sp. SL1]MCY1661420.1 hypothetical protein [Chryseobacterium sp. SL1]
MKILITYSLIFVMFFCKAQQILPLNTSASFASEYSYFKDLNNELNQYTGLWKATIQDKTIILNISVQIKEPIVRFNKNFFRDQLFIRYEIKENGIIVESTLNKNFTNDIALSIKSAYSENNGSMVKLLFSGGNCSVGIGLITLKKINTTTLSWDYHPGTTTRNDITCPPNLDYNIYLPETENLIFTKQ